MDERQERRKERAMNRVLITKGNPTPGDRHVNGPMTQFSEAFVKVCKANPALYSEIAAEKA